MWTYHNLVDVFLIEFVLQSITRQCITFNFLKNLVSQLYFPHSLQLLRDSLDLRPEILLWFFYKLWLIFWNLGWPLEFWEGVFKLVLDTMSALIFIQNHINLHFIFHRQKLLQICRIETIGVHQLGEQPPQLWLKWRYFSFNVLLKCLDLSQLTLIDFVQAVLLLHDYY